MVICSTNMRDDIAVFFVLDTMVVSEWHLLLSILIHHDYCVIERTMLDH